MKYIKTDNGVISTEEKNHEMRLAQGHAYLQKSAPPGGVEIHPQDIGKEVAALCDEITSQFVGMEEAVHMMAMGLVSGGNVFLWSLPGAAKSSIARMFAAGINGTFFSLNLGPDTSKNDLFGPPSISAMRNDKWDRALSRVAGDDIALFDEWDKASSVVQNQLLTAMEEKMVTTDDGNKEIPLLLGIAAANDVGDATLGNPVWDRLLFRMNVKYPRDYKSLLSVTGGRKPIKPRLSPEDIKLIQGWVDYQAMYLPQEICESMSVIYAEMKRKGFEVSPRRFIRWARAVMAKAILDGRTDPEMEDLYTGANILWVKPEDKEKVQKIVGASSDPEKATLIQAEATIEGVDQELVKLNKDTPNVLSKVMDLQTGLNTHRKRLEGIRNGGVHKEQLLKKIQELNSDLIDKASEFSS